MDQSIRSPNGSAHRAPRSSSGAQSRQARAHPGAEVERRADKRKEARGIPAAARSGAWVVAGMREGGAEGGASGRGRNESGGRREFGTDEEI